MSLLKNKKCLFIGKKNCYYTLSCIKFLKKFEVKLKIIFCNKRNSKLPKSLKSWKGDFIFSYKNYWLLPRHILDSAKIAAINFHPATPNYPGSGSYNWAIYNNSKYFGITVHIMNEKIDNGKILDFFKFKINSNICVDNLINQTDKFSVIFFKKFINKIDKLDLVQFKKILRQPPKFIWKGPAKKISDLDAKRYITKDITPKELFKRINAFHSIKFPLCLIYKSKKLFLTLN